MKFKVLLYNLKCGLRDWWDFNLGIIGKNRQILILAKIFTHTVFCGMWKNCLFKKVPRLQFDSLQLFDTILNIMQGVCHLLLMIGNSFQSSSV